MFGLQNISPTEIIIIVIVLLILFGSKKLPEFIKGMGEGIREIIKAFQGDDKDAKGKK